MAKPLQLELFHVKLVELEDYDALCQLLAEDWERECEQRHADVARRAEGEAPRASPDHREGKRRRRGA